MIVTCIHSHMKFISFYLNNMLVLVKYLKLTEAETKLVPFNTQMFVFT
jgi:hypothetical protein